MKKIFLTSDIHGENKIFQKLEGKLAVDTPLYILGDVFDNKNVESQEYKLMIINIYDGLKKNKIKLFTGNHDELLYTFLIRPNITNEEEAKLAFQQITTIYTDETFDTIQRLLGYKCLDVIYASIVYLCDIAAFEDEIDYYTVVESYYDTVESIKNIMSEKEKKIYEIIKYISIKSKESEILEFGDKVFYFSHSGDGKDAMSTEIYYDSFTPADDIDYYVVGHISHQSIKRFESDINNEYISNCDLNFLKGKYVYNNKKKIINIDDGSHSNCVELKI